VALVMKMMMGAERTNHRVVKTLAPTDRGAIHLVRHYGDALICVRHRTDAKGKLRYTTVELLVSTTPIRPRPLKWVCVRVDPSERLLQAVVKRAGGVWDARDRLWRLPSRVAGILSLRSRIVNR
jgi:hypothetical protein